MEKLITIINPIGGTFATRRGGKSHSINKGEQMAARKRRKTRKRKTTKRRTTRRRRNPRASRKRTYRKRRTYKKVARRRKRRNPSKRKFRLPVKQFFSKSRITRAVALIAGLGASAVLKQFAMRMVPNPLFSRFYGLLAIALGATINLKAKRGASKNFGTGIFAYGLLDLAVSNIPQLAAYLPAISGPAAFMGGNTIGRSVYPASMGANISANQPVSIVGMGANIEAGVPSEIVGHDYEDLAEALEMSIG